MRPKPAHLGPDYATQFADHSVVARYEDERVELAVSSGDALTSGWDRGQSAVA